jgi:hypothetical protein
MKRLLSFTSVIIILSLNACDKACTTPKPSGCDDELPIGATCTAYWESWLYNESANSCEFTGYSGCNVIGFETKQACEECECRN